MIRVRDAVQAGALGELSGFRQEFYRCLPARADALFELAEAVLCADGPVRSLAGLSLVPEHRRGHGALYDAVSHGRIDFAGCAGSLAGLPLPRAADGRLVLAVDVSCWLRPGAADQPGAVVLPRLRAGEGPGADDPGLALLVGRGAGAGPHVVDGGAGCGPAGPR